MAAGMRLSWMRDSDPLNVCLRNYARFLAQWRHSVVLGCLSFHQSIKCLLRQFPRQSQAQWRHSRIGVQYQNL